MTKYTFQLIAVICNRARSENGDSIKVTLDGRSLWSSKKLLFHPRCIYLAEFEQGGMHINGHMDSLPTCSKENFCISVNSLPAILKLQVNTFLDFHTTVGRLVIKPTYASSKIIQQRICAFGADYCLRYRLTAS